MLKLKFRIESPGDKCALFDWRAAFGLLDSFSGRLVAISLTLSHGMARPYKVDFVVFGTDVKLNLLLAYDCTQSGTMLVRIPHCLAEGCPNGSFKVHALVSSMIASSSTAFAISFHPLQWRPLGLWPTADTIHC